MMQINDFSKNNMVARFIRGSPWGMDDDLLIFKKRDLTRVVFNAGIRNLKFDFKNGKIISNTVDTQEALRSWETRLEVIQGRSRDRAKHTINIDYSEYEDRELRLAGARIK